MPKRAFMNLGCCLLLMAASSPTLAQTDEQPIYPIGGFVLRAQKERLSLLEKRLAGAGWRVFGCLSPEHFEAKQRDLLIAPMVWERVAETLNELKRELSVTIGLAPPSLPAANAENCK